MALNWAMLDANRSPVPLPHELIIRTISAADVSVTIPNTPPRSTSTSGGSGGERKLAGNGKIWLTDNRVHLLELTVQWRILTVSDLADIRSTRRPRKEHRINCVRLSISAFGIHPVYKV